MKVALLAIYMLFSLNAYSYDLCDILPSESSEGDVTVIYEKAVEFGNRFSDWEQERLMTFITHEDSAYLYVEDEDYNEFEIQTFEQVYNFFGRSDFGDTLDLQVMRDNRTGRIYSYVYSYPGDNIVGIYQNDNGDIVGHISDGSLMVDGKWCKHW